MKTSVAVILLTAGAFFVRPMFAVPVTFNLRDTGATVEIESGMIVRGGITATLSPLVQSSSGALNQTSTAFGVNAAGSGDATDLLDGLAGAESISIVFNSDVVLTALDLSAFSGTEAASLKIGNFSALSLSDTGSATDSYAFSANNSVLTGQSVILAWVSGNGFSFDSFTVEAVNNGATVPDRLSTGIAALALVTILVFPRHVLQWKAVLSMRR